MSTTTREPAATPAAAVTVLDELADLVEEPDLAPCANELAALRSALENGPQLTGWPDCDVVAMFVREESFSAPRRLRLSRLLNAGRVLSGALVFLPLMITWFGLSQAADAYERMLTDPIARREAGGRGFLELWQSGFQGRLSPSLTFEPVALYTLGAIVTLILVTVLGGELRRGADERARLRREALSARLWRTLTGAQLILNQSRLHSPARFAAELSGAAQRLKELLELVGATQDSTSGLARQNEAVASRLRESADSLDTTMAALRDAAAEVITAAATMRSAGAVLHEGVASAAARLDQSTAHATEELARQQEAGRTGLEDLHSRMNTTIERLNEQIEATLTATTTQLARQHETGRTELAELHSRLDAVAERLTGQVAAVTDAMLNAGRRHAESLDAAARDSAELIGTAYEEAVAAAAVTLAARMTEVNDLIVVSVRELRASTQHHADALAELTRALADRGEALRRDGTAHAGEAAPPGDTASRNGAARPAETTRADETAYSDEMRGT